MSPNSILSTGGCSYILRVRAETNGVYRQILRTVRRREDFATVEDARTRAREMYEEARQRHDPKVVRQTKAAAVLIRDAFPEWLKRREGPGKIRPSMRA